MGKDREPSGNIDAKLAVKRNAENANDWEFSEEAKYLYGMAEIFRDRLFATMLPTEQGELPDPVISFDDLRNKKTLAAYTLRRNPQGLLDEITFNKVHYVEEEGKKVWKFGRWAQLETLLHEQVHLWQQNFGKRPVNPEKVTHNKEFVDICEQLGLHPLPVVGAHYAVADGPFAQLMGELGIERPDDVPRIEGKSSKRNWFRPVPEKGKTTLHKWVCPDCGLNVRIGIGSDPHLVHNVCSEIRGEKVFLVKDDGKEHTIYKAK